MLHSLLVDLYVLCNVRVFAIHFSLMCLLCRYGNLFKSHALGSPVVISMDPELNRYILKNESKGLVPGYPVSMRNILGNSNIAEVHGALHRRIRGSILSFIGPAAIRDHLLPEVDKFMRSFLDNWAGKTIDIQHKTKQV